MSQELFEDREGRRPEFRERHGLERRVAHAARQCRVPTRADDHRLTSSGLPRTIVARSAHDSLNASTDARNPATASPGARSPGLEPIRPPAESAALRTRLNGATSARAGTAIQSRRLIANAPTAVRVPRFFMVPISNVPMPSNAFSG